MGTLSLLQIDCWLPLGIQSSMVRLILSIGWSLSPCKGRPTSLRNVSASTRRQASWPPLVRQTRLLASHWMLTSDGLGMAAKHCGQRTNSWVGFKQLSRTVCGIVKILWFNAGRNCPGDDTYFCTIHRLLFAFRRGLELGQASVLTEWCMLDEK